MGIFCRERHEICVTPFTSQITSPESNKDMGDASMKTFTLDRMENFDDWVLDSQISRVIDERIE
jgi:hypothetical protein